MQKRRLLWQLYFPQILIIQTAFLAVTLYVSDTLRTFHTTETIKDLEARAQVAAEYIKTPFLTAQYDAVNRLCRDIGGKSSTRFTVVLASGEVAGDSHQDPDKMENHAGRPEIKAALGGRTGSSIHFSQTLKEDMVYVAIPLKRSDEIIGAVRASISTEAFDKALVWLYVKVASGSLVVTLLTVYVIWKASMRISRHLEEIRRGAERFAEGRLTHELMLTGPEAASLEVRGLAESINDMALRLTGRIRLEARQRHQLEAVFAGMAESIFVIDSRNRIIRINRAAAKLLGAGREEIVDKHIQEVIKDQGLREFVIRAGRSSTPLEEEFDLSNREGKKILQARGVLLRDDKRSEIGALIVLNDVTRLRNLEKVRKDFVANVSHELKTPVTAIKGYVETLLDGAMNDPVDARRFLEIVARQAERLHAIVEDLLMLSRLERDEMALEVSLTRSKLRDSLQAAVDACTARAAANAVTINLECRDSLTAVINPPLLEQAVINLIVNAVKYSNREGLVLVTAELIEDKIEISVRDWGCGIAEEHLPRLFERFYRSDQARSRRLGGTGLGLAIVKHIIQLHHGDVTVQSMLGQGTTFTIHLPG